MHPAQESFAVSLCNSGKYVFFNNANNSYQPAPALPLAPCYLARTETWDRPGKTPCRPETGTQGQQHMCVSERAHVWARTCLSVSEYVSVSECARLSMARVWASTCMSVSERVWACARVWAITCLSVSEGARMSERVRMSEGAHSSERVRVWAYACVWACARASGWGRKSPGQGLLWVSVEWLSSEILTKLWHKLSQRAVAFLSRWREEAAKPRNKINNVFYNNFKNRCHLLYL